MDRFVRDRGCCFDLAIRNDLDMTMFVYRGHERVCLGLRGFGLVSYFITQKYLTESNAEFLNSLIFSKLTYGSELFCYRLL